MYKSKKCNHYHNVRKSVANRACSLIVCRILLVTDAERGVHEHHIMEDQNQQHNDFMTTMNNLVLMPDKIDFDFEIICVCE